MSFAAGKQSAAMYQFPELDTAAEGYRCVFNMARNLTRRRRFLSRHRSARTPAALCDESEAPAGTSDCGNDQGRSARRFPFARQNGQAVGEHASITKLQWFVQLPRDWTRSGRREIFFITNCICGDSMSYRREDRVGWHDPPPLWRWRHYVV